MAAKRTRKPRPQPVMVVRAVRTGPGYRGGWIVHDMRDPATVRTPPWTRTATRRWRAYPTHTEALRAACRAIKNHAPLPAASTAYSLAR